MQNNDELMSKFGGKLIYLASPFYSESVQERAMRAYHRLGILLQVSLLEGCMRVLACGVHAESIYQRWRCFWSWLRCLEGDV